MKSIFLLTLAFFGLFGFVSTGLHAQTDAAAATIGDALAENGSTTLLLDALEAAKLISVLKEKGNTVLLAPTNAAFAALPDGALEALLKPGNAAALRELLLHHVVADTEGAFATTASEKLRGTEASTSGDIACSNGAIYLIDRILLPPGFDLKALME